ncbi:MAG: hypothetical protein ACI9MU_004431 [Alphaproteobacteria bacterium]|jgi:hypothetical protein
MGAIENAAYISVGRACGFAGLAIFCVIFGLSFEPALAARAGGGLCVGLALILAAYAYRAPTRPYKRTELWLILAKDKRPPAAYAQRVIGSALRDTYIWFSRQSALIAIVLLIVSVALQIFGVSGLWDEPSPLTAATFDHLPSASASPDIPVP